MTRKKPVDQTPGLAAIFADAVKLDPKFIKRMQAYQLYLQGSTPAEIAALSGCSERSVRGWARDLKWFEDRNRLDEILKILSMAQTIRSALLAFDVEPARDDR
jgi:uncharacterized protein YjcR